MSEQEPLLVQPDSSRYEVEEKVAAGGMGVIYRVLDRTLGRTVAMKVCSRADGSSARDASAHDSDRVRFVEEAKVTAQLDHPGIVPVHELGVSTGDQLYFTMPLVKGQSLSKTFELARAGQDGWNLSRALAALIKVCQAVAYAHSKGIVHRDLKPANVMVGRFGEVYVLDWGLAKVRGSRDAADGAVMGTPAYMPPEQAAGKSELIDERSDVYALGAMLYELLAGQAPYASAGLAVSPQMILSSILSGPPKSVRAMNPIASAELVAVCDKAMARDPARRYSTAFDLAEDLQAFLDHRVVTAYRTGAAARFRAWCYRHRTLLKVAACVAVALTVGFLAIGWALRLREAEPFVAHARAQLSRYLALKSDIPRLQKVWLDSRMAQRSWAPAWQRAEEIQNFRVLELARKELDSTFNAAAVDFSNALRVAPPSGMREEARRQLTELYDSRHRDIVAGESLLQSAEFYRQRIEELDPGAPLRALARPGRIEIASEPAGAEVYCFRYEEGEDTRLLPLPFDPALGHSLAGSSLRVSAILNPEQHQRIFAVGDEVLEAKGKRVRTTAELARALEGTEVGEEVPVRLERKGAQIDRAWTPFPATSRSPWLNNGSLLVVHEQLGLVFEGYPLDFTGSCRLGETRADAPVRAEIPAGSYLLVLRKNGYRDARFPVVIPWREEIETVRLLKEREIPAGFVYVPKGPFSFGGDVHAFQSLERGDAVVDGFFMARFETTVSEYLEFLNDTEVRERTDAKGLATALSPEIKEELDRSKGRVLLVPARPSNGELLFERRDDGAWEIKTRPTQALFPSSPILAVSQLAAQEYAHWRSRKDGKWRYRLPNDLEWEKAARGVDRRAHVWGEYLVWSFCWSADGLWSAYIPITVGAFASDESVYGVRDMAGSVAELTSSTIERRYVTRRGGSWEVSDAQNLRVANRNGRLAAGRGTESGFRLVAELREPE